MDMDSQFTKSSGMILMLVMSLFFVSCQDTIPNRATISKGKSTIQVPDCESNEKLVEATDTDPAFCEPLEPTRPDLAISFKSDYCACKDGKAVSFGNCASFCATRGTGGADHLFASFDVTADISLSGLKNVLGWCNTVISATAANPKCVLQAKDSSQNVIEAPVVGTPNGNSLVFDITNLSFDETYVLTLVETSSGAKSKPVQIIKPSVQTPLSLLGPLKIAPISQYSCVIRQFSLDPVTQDPFYEKAYRVHFYFLPRLRPAKVDASTIFCHDIVKYGTADEEGRERFEEIPGTFNLWDTNDPRFFDNNGNGNDDINEVIAQKVLNFGGGTLSAGSKFFIKFTWPGSPTLSDQAGNTSNTDANQPIGYYMAPWIDQQNQFKSFCLNSTHYNSSSALFKAFRDIIGVDTEGLYVGEKSPETVFSSNGQVIGTGVKDYILIRESDLKAVWYYMNNGVPTAPTDDNVQNVAVYFNYPLNKASPFIKTSTQRIYRVKGAAELSGSSTNTSQTSGSTSAFPPHDRKIGCIPKL